MNEQIFWILPTINNDDTNSNETVILDLTI